MRDTASQHRNVSSALQHANSDVHSLYGTLLTLPAKEEILAIARAFMDELYAHDAGLAPHLYPAIWHQLNSALAACS